MITGSTRVVAIDESVHEVSGVYVMGLVEVSTAARDSVRDALGGLVPSSHRHPHWHAEDEATRAKLVMAVAEMDVVAAAAYGAAFAGPRRQESARSAKAERPSCGGKLGLTSGIRRPGADDYR